jgi:transposase
MDTHKKFVMVAAVNEHQAVVQPALKVSMNNFKAWVAETLSAQDQVVIEVTANSWHLYDMLVEYAGTVIVANPYKTRLIAEARIKTDKVDALILARLLAARFIADVWVPSALVRQQRALASHRDALARQRTQVKNRLHGLLFRHNLSCPHPNLFTRNGRDWLVSLDLPATEQLSLAHLLRQLDLLEEQVADSEQMIAQLAAQDERIPYLLQIPGIGCFTAFAILATIGNIERFDSPKRLAAFAGLVPSRHQSGNKAYNGHITKAGAPILRWLMVEAARVAIRFDPHWRQVYDRIRQRRGDSIAVVAVARKLLVVIWHLLTHKTAYHHLQPQTFVSKLQNWAWRIGREQLPTSSSAEFVTHKLLQLGFLQLAQQLQTDRKGKLRVLAA